MQSIGKRHKESSGLPTVSQFQRLGIRCRADLISDLVTRSADFGSGCAGSVPQRGQRMAVPNKPGPAPEHAEAPEINRQETRSSVPPARVSETPLIRFMRPIHE